MRLPFWASICTLCAVVILCSLGSWQLYRLDWKQGILAKLEAEYAKDALQVPLEGEDFKESAQSTDEIVLKRGYIIGRYLNDKAVKISPKIFDQKIGEHLVTPFELEKGQGIVLVNRGWIPKERDMPKGKDIREIDQQVKLVGMVRPAPLANMFTPINKPQKEQWYIVNIADISKARDLTDVFPRMFYLEEAENKDHFYPLVEASRPEIANNHAQYAAFWFSMAVVLLLVFVVRFSR